MLIFRVRRGAKGTFSRIFDFLTKPLASYRISLQEHQKTYRKRPFGTDKELFR